MKIFFLLFFISSPLFAYTLNNNFGASFKHNEIKVYIAGDTTCSTAQLNIYDLNDLITPANNNFWNRVPTSNIRLSNGGFTGIISNINDGVLCAPTDDECITTAGANVIQPVDGIVIACNNNPANFNGSNVLAVTIPNKFSGRDITGAVILINDSSTTFAGLSKSDKIGVIAHEVGHAIGLGHTDDTAALMYYRTVKQRKTLGEDDMRGVSYLYPMKLDGMGLLGGCGTISSKPQGPSGNSFFWQMGITLALVILIAELIKLLRFKTRSST
jgi:hypothetical protein